LIGINAPERGEAYYEKAKERLQKLIGGKEVVLERDSEDKDQYGRLLRYVYLNGRNINAEMVREGLAIAYSVKPNTRHSEEIRKAEAYAIRKGLGLWKLSRNACGHCIKIERFHWNAKGNDCKNLNDEYVVFKNECKHDCNISGWKVRDNSSRNEFVFPEVTLPGGSEATLYSGCGLNSRTKLYWCNKGHKCNAVWDNEGDTLYLRDSNGALVLYYSYEK